MRLASIILPGILLSLAVPSSSLFGLDSILGGLFGGPKCDKLSLPDFFDIGSCLGDKKDLCKESNEDNLGAYVTELLICTAKGFSKLKFGSQLYLIQEMLKSFTGREGGNGTDIFTMLCNTASKFAKGIDCNSLKADPSMTCGSPVDTKVPPDSNYSKCFTQDHLTCNRGDPVEVSVIMGTLKIPLCLLKYMHPSDVKEMIKQLIKEGFKNVSCAILQILEKILEKVNIPMAGLAKIAINARIRSQCKSTLFG